MSGTSKCEAAEAPAAPGFLNRVHLPWEPKHLKEGNASGGQLPWAAQHEMGNEKGRAEMFCFWDHVCGEQEHATRELHRAAAPGVPAQPTAGFTHYLEEHHAGVHELEACLTWSSV